MFNEIVKTFTDKNNFDGSSYNVYHKIFKAIDFGIPQKRERVFIIGVLDKKINLDQCIKQTIKNIKETFPNYFETPNVWDAISNLDTEESDGSVVDLIPETNYQKYLQSDNAKTFNHVKPRHSSIVKKRMSLIREGENWTILPEKIKSVHSGAYGRLKKNGASPTITTRFDTPSGGRFIHPIENRTLSPREGARLQSFPDDFEFLGNKTSIYKQIGNAVPPKLSFFIANMTSIILSNEYTD
jgi:DNA (cytosine-5)-methyltransferase 1